MNVIFDHIIKKVKRLVDIAPHWGEPRISGVSWLALCNVIFVMLLLVLRLDV